MTLPDLSTFFRFASSLEGESIETVGGRTRFRVKVTPDGLEYYPMSSGKRRFQEPHLVERILDRYRTRRSMRAGDYRDITWNASYALGILRRYLSLRGGES